MCGNANSSDRLPTTMIIDLSHAWSQFSDRWSPKWISLWTTTRSKSSKCGIVASSCNSTTIRMTFCLFSPEPCTPNSILRTGKGLCLSWISYLLFLRDVEHCPRTTETWRGFDTSVDWTQSIGGNWGFWEVGTGKRCCRLLNLKLYATEQRTCSRFCWM